MTRSKRGPGLADDVTFTADSDGRYGRARAVDRPLRREGSVFVLTLQAGENRLNRPFLDALNRAFDTVEASPGPAALVTVGEEKFYSTGLDLDWLGGAGQGEAPRFVNTVIALFARLVAVGVPTVAALNGHAFAAGGGLPAAPRFRGVRGGCGVFFL